MDSSKRITCCHYNSLRTLTTVLNTSSPYKPTRTPGRTCSWGGQRHHFIPAHNRAHKHKTLLTITHPKVNKQMLTPKQDLCSCHSKGILKRTIILSSCLADVKCLWKKNVYECSGFTIYAHKNINCRHISLIVEYIELWSPTPIFSTTTALLR